MAEIWRFENVQKLHYIYEFAVDKGYPLFIIGSPYRLQFFWCIFKSLYLNNGCSKFKIFFTTILRKKYSFAVYIQLNFYWLANYGFKIDFFNSPLRTLVDF